MYEIKLYRRSIYVYIYVRVYKKKIASLQDTQGIRKNYITNHVLYLSLQQLQVSSIQPIPSCLESTSYIFTSRSPMLFNFNHIVITVLIEKAIKRALLFTFRFCKPMQGSGQQPKMQNVQNPAAATAKTKNLLPQTKPLSCGICGFLSKILHDLS